MTKALDIDAVSVAYGTRTVVHDVSLRVEAGEIGSLLGPSGCGKTTLLRAIAGFEPVASGRIALGGRTISEPDRTVVPERRRVGMVFQDFALFPHLDVERNVAFGLHGTGRREKRERVQALLEMVGLGGSARAMPHELSGGQQQRIALARALAPRPDILLLDEPFSSLDSELREELAAEVRGLLQRHGTTAVLVTHDQQEAFAMADRVSLMHNGRIVQTATPAGLYQHPADEFVANFIGQGAVLDVRIAADGAVDNDLGHWPGPPPPSGTARLLLRPEQVRYDPGSAVRLEIVERRFCGAHYRCQLQLADGQQITGLAPGDADVVVGQRLPVAIDLRQAVVLGPGSRAPEPD
jgi:iron(III) transport system ATP-binding protein